MAVAQLAIAMSVTHPEFVLPAAEPKSARPRIRVTARGICTIVGGVALAWSAIKAGAILGTTAVTFAAGGGAMSDAVPAILVVGAVGAALMFVR